MGWLSDGHRRAMNENYKREVCGLAPKTPKSLVYEGNMKGVVLYERFNCLESTAAHVQKNNTKLILHGESDISRDRGVNGFIKGDGRGKNTRMWGRMGNRERREGQRYEFARQKGVRGEKRSSERWPRTSITINVISRYTVSILTGRCLL